MSNVIFAVQGWFDGFNHCLESIRQYSPTTRIHILGNAETAQHVDCVPIEGYFDWASRFAKDFVHLSVNGSTFELLCFQRWYAMYEYAKAQGISEFWSFDWDCLVFTDLAQEKVSTGMTSPIHVFYTRKLEWLRCWLEMVHEAFIDRNELFKEWERSYLDANWCSLSDMSVAHHTTGHLNELRAAKHDGYWDNNISLGTHGFMLDAPTTQRANNIKKLKWENGRPYALHAMGQWVPIKSFHCWANYKVRMYEFLQKGLACKPPQPQA